MSIASQRAAALILSEFHVGNNDYSPDGWSWIPALPTRLAALIDHAYLTAPADPFAQTVERGAPFDEDLYAPKNLIPGSLDSHSSQS